MTGVTVAHFLLPEGLVQDLRESKTRLAKLRLDVADRHRHVFV